MSDVRGPSVQGPLADLLGGGASDSLPGGAGGLGLGQTLIGSIEWDSALGRPRDDPMAAAFDVTCFYEETVTDFKDPSAKTTIPTDLPVELADGTSEDGRHRVLFTVSGAIDGSMHTVLVDFSEQVRWERPFVPIFLTRFRRISPPRRVFEKSHWLVEPFEVLPSWWFF